MPFYRRRWYRRRSYGGRYGRRFYRRRWYRYGKYANSGSRSRMQVVIPVEGIMTADLRANSSESDVSSICPFISMSASSDGKYRYCGCGAIDTSLYHMYSTLYEEVRCVGMSVKIALIGGVSDSANMKVMNLYTAFDRRLCLHDLTSEYPTLAKLKSYGSVKSQMFVNNSVVMGYRSVYASDIQEKTGFGDCSYKQYQNTIEGAARYYNTLVGWENNPTMPYFVPCFYFGFDTDWKPTSVQSVQFSVKCTFRFEFRNPKFGGVPASKSGDERVMEVDAVRSAVAGKSDGGVGDVESAFKKLQISGVLGDDDDVVLKDWKEKRLAKRKARLEKIKKLRALEKELEKDDDTLIDPEEEVLPDVDDDLLMDDDDDAPTQPIKELENKSSS